MKVATITRPGRCAGHTLFAVALAGLLLFSGPPWADGQISSIRADVSLINKNAKKYRRERRQVEGLSLEGAQAVYFSSGGDLRKATAKIYGETFRAAAELYYNDGSLIFAFQRLEKYDTHIAADPPPKVARVIETRVYYSGGGAVRVMEDKKQLSPASDDFRVAAEAMQDLSEKLRAALRDR